MNEVRKEGRKERTNERMTTATDWAQVNTTKSEGSSAICGPRSWKSMGEKWKSQLTPGPRGSAAPAVGDRAFPVAGRSATLCPVFANKKLSIADKPRDAFRSQSMSPNIVPFDMLGMVS